MPLFRLSASAFMIRPGADKFVQAYTTQTPAATRGAFIDAKGRAIAVFDRVRLDADRSVFVVAASVLDRLKKHLKPFLFLMDAEAVDLPHSVYWAIAAADGAGAVPAGTDTAGRFADPEGWILQRPRHTILISDRPLDPTVAPPADREGPKGEGSDDEALRLFRVRNNLPLQGEDYDDPMLLNLDEPELVSWTKGCYLGQEIMARVHYKGRPPLRLTAIGESECPAELLDQMTSLVTDPGAGGRRGFVFLPTRSGL